MFCTNEQAYHVLVRKVCFILKTEMVLDCQKGLQKVQCCGVPKCKEVPFPWAGLLSAFSLETVSK